jgi:hypothetical protein
MRNVGWGVGVGRAKDGVGVGPAGVGTGVGVALTVVVDGVARAAGSGTHAARSSVPAMIESAIRFVRTWTMVTSGSLGR